jgi:hypothetical protein
MFGLCDGTAKREWRSRLNHSLENALVVQSLEPATRPPDHMGIDPIQRQPQLLLLKVTVVADPAADTWIVDLG